VKYEDLWHQCLTEDKFLRAIQRESSDDKDTAQRVRALPDASALHVRLHRNHRQSYRASVLDAIDCGRKGECSRIRDHLRSFEREPRGFGDDCRGYVERLAHLSNDELARELSHIDWDSDPEGGVSLYGNTVMPAELAEEACRRLSPARATVAGSVGEPGGAPGL
jgi:hypothetical protein